MPVWDGLIGSPGDPWYRGYRPRAWERRGQRPAILVVDVTHAFVDERFNLGCGEPARQAVREMRRLLDVGREMGLPIVYSRGDHFKTQAEYGIWRGSGGVKLLGEGVRLEAAYEIVPELGRRDDEPVVIKSKPSAFFGSHLNSILNWYGTDGLIVCGLTTSGCVRASVVDAFSLNYWVVVPESCVADRWDVSHRVGLFDMHAKYADVEPLEETLAWLEYLRRAGAPPDRRSVDLAAPAFEALQRPAPSP